MVWAAATMKGREIVLQSVRNVLNYSKNCSQIVYVRIAEAARKAPLF